MGDLERCSVDAAKKAEHDAEVEKRTKGKQLNVEAKEKLAAKDINAFVTAIGAGTKRGRPPGKRAEPADAAQPAAVDPNEERARAAAAIGKYTRYYQNRNAIIREAVGGVPPNPKWTADEAQAQLDRVREQLNSYGAGAMVRRGVVSMAQGAEWVTMRAGINPNNMYQLDGFGGFMEGLMGDAEAREELQPELGEAEAELGGFCNVPWQIRFLSKFHTLLAGYTAHKRQKVAPVVTPPPAASEQVNRPEGG